jgi:hypothetical protein
MLCLDRFLSYFDGNVIKFLTYRFVSMVFIRFNMTIFRLALCAFLIIKLCFVSKAFSDGFDYYGTNQQIHQQAEDKGIEKSPIKNLKYQDIVDNHEPIVTNLIQRFGSKARTFNISAKYDTNFLDSHVTDDRNLLKFQLQYSIFNDVAVSIATKSSYNNTLSESPFSQIEIGYQQILQSQIPNFKHGMQFLFENQTTFDKNLKTMYKINSRAQRDYTGYYISKYSYSRYSLMSFAGVNFYENNYIRALFNPSFFASIDDKNTIGIEINSYRVFYVNDQAYKNYRGYSIVPQYTRTFNKNFKLQLGLGRSIDTYNRTQAMQTQLIFRGVYSI